MTISKQEDLIGTFAREDLPDANFGRKTFLTVRAVSGGEGRYAYIWADQPFDTDDHVFDALLDVYTRSGWDAGGPHTITVRRISEPWVTTGASGLTWNNAPAVAGTAVTLEVDDTDDGTLIEIDVTSILEEAASGEPFYGFRLAVDTTGIKRLHSARAAAGEVHPSLATDWSADPGPPTDQSPSGGRSISLAQPPFGWVFADTKGEYQTEFQLQIDNATDFATPVYDSDWVASEDWEHTPDAGDFAATDGSTYYWRVRVRDNYGLESDWSDVASFRRDTKGTLAITNPPASPNNQVTDTTPVITHTFSDRTQEAVEYLLYEFDDDDSQWHLIYRTRRTTTDTSFTLPEEDDEGNILLDLELYRIKVRVWDTLDRESRPGDRAYVELTREFTVVPGDPDPVETLVVAQGEGTDGGAVELTWTITVQPDAFTILVDGRIVALRIPSEDVLVGGSTYSYLLWNVSGRTEHDFEVRAVQLDGGEWSHSTGNPVETFQPEPKGIWLVAIEEDIRLVLTTPAGSSEQKLAIAKSGATYNPVGRRAPVVIIDAVRGYEGSIAGSIGDYLSVAGETWKHRLERLQGLRPDSEIRLIFDDLNIRVALNGEPDVGFIGEGEWSATIPLVQTGSFTFRTVRP
jgi:hypothetical protein